MSDHHISVTVFIDLFTNNVRRLRHRFTPAKLCVVLKGNAYGHGISALAPAAIQAGADVLGICTNQEARIIRCYSDDIPIIRLRPALAAELDESVDLLNVQEPVGTREAAEYLSRAGIRIGRPIPVHLKIDTGMGRSGFLPSQLDEVKRICRLPGLHIVGIMSHLSKADAIETEDTRRQLDTFQLIRQQLSTSMAETTCYHIHNSAAAIRLGADQVDMVRIGAACYGLQTSLHFTNPSELKPVMSVKTRIAQIRQLPAGQKLGYGGLFTTRRASRIVSLPVGFGEGYPRSLFNKGSVLIKGRRCPIVGRISLNTMSVDITELEDDVQWGEEVVLFGEQNGQTISFEEMANQFDSVHTEINMMMGTMNRIEYRT
jgi:alanine racemase